MDQRERWEESEEIDWYWHIAFNASGSAFHSYPSQARPQAAAFQKERPRLVSAESAGTPRSSGLEAEAALPPRPTQGRAANLTGFLRFGLMWIFHINDLRMK